MATLPGTDVERTEHPMTMDDAAAELYMIVEGHFDSLGLSNAERDERYDKLEKRFDATDSSSAKA
jgi:hypothetical protein